jgi:predicted SprT family Zn-dependent metalloprotease
MRHLLKIIPLSFLLFGCTFEPTYRVDSEFEPYVQRFVQEAALRNRTFDVHSSGLIVEFDDLEEGTAGVCYYLNPIKIKFDREYWEKIGNYRNADEMRENLVFHELGHGLLNRKHDNKYLSNGDWKTIMCGGNVKDNRSWNINYRSIRREYYIDELFNQSTPAPAWATDNPDFSDSLEPSYIEDDFSTTSNPWITGTGSQYDAYIANGEYIINWKPINGTYVYRQTDISTQADFYCEARIKIVSSDKSNKCGIIFGNSDEKEANYFIINNNGRMFMGNSKCYGWYTELLKSSIVANGYNVLGLRKRGEYLYYYINNQLAYIDKMDVMVEGSQFGLNVGGNSTIYVDYFKLNAPESSFKKATVKPDNWCTIQEQEIRPAVLSSHEE